LRSPPKKITYQDQIEIRPISLEDSSLIYQAVKNSIDSLKRFKAWAHFKKDQTTALSIYSLLTANTALGKEAHFCGFKKNTKDFLFCIALFQDNRLNHHSLELGYWVSAEHSGEGYGTLAAQIIIYLAFFYYGADRLCVRCDETNKGSMSIINKCGFQKEGLIRNSLAKPTEEMLKNGFTPNRSTILFSLIPEDLKNIKWFEAIEKDLKFTSFI
jgi:RimJ/RimL family protein N-acetyltransferase